MAGVAGGSNSSDGISLMSCQVFGNNVAGFAESYAYAADNGAVISQNSWGYTSEGFYEQAVLDGIDYFIANAGYDSGGNPVGPMQGGLVIFAAGNSNSSGQHYPGYYAPTLAVASTNHNDIKSWYSNYGSWVDIAAPGGETAVTTQGVLSTLTSNNYGFYQGTSMACPHVSGVAALIVSEFAATGITPAQVRGRLTETTDDLDTLNPTYAGLLGTGRMNAAASLMTDDGIPPNAITDLASTSLRFNEVELGWTSPVDSDNGSATSYEIRYSETLIDSANFSAALLAGYLNANVARSTELFLLDGLTQTTQYYVAIKSSDFFGNTSNISNVLSFTTPEPPIINLNPASLTSNLFSGSSEVKQLVISNTGASDLTYSIGSVDYATTSDIGLNKVYNIEEHEPPLKGQKDMRVGNPVLNSKGDDNGGFGYSWIDSNEAGGPTFDWVEISSTGTQLSLGDDGYHQTNLAFDFEYYGELKNTLYISANGFITFNVTGASSYGNTPLPNLNYPNELIAAMWNDLYAGSNVYYLSEADRFIVQYNNVSYLGAGGSYTFQIILYQTGAIKIQYLSLSTEPTYYTLGIENPAGDDGMEIAYNTSYITNGLAVSISPNSNFISNLDPVNGVVSAGESDTLNVTFDAAGLIGGVYEANLAINSNDPVSPEILVPLQLNVTGAPNIELQTSFEFDTLFVGAVDSTTLTLSNTGTDTLTITTLTVDEAAFSTNLIASSIVPGESHDFKVYFQPLLAQDYSGNLIIESNDPTDSIFTLNLAGVGQFPPIINVDTTLIADSLFTGETSTKLLAIENSGNSNLEYSISLQSINPTSTMTKQKVVGIPRSSTLNNSYSKSNVNTFAAEYIGDHIKFGISDYGEIMPYQYGIGNEHLAIGTWVSGYSVIYDNGGSDAIFYAGYGDRNGIVPLTYTELVNNDARVEVEVVTQTTDAKLQITRYFSFEKNSKNVKVETTIENVSGSPLNGVVFKTYADWDVDSDFTDDNWNIDESRNMIYAYNSVYVSIATQESPDFADMNGWSDYTRRLTDEDVKGEIFGFDGFELLHYDLGTISSGNNHKIHTAFASGDNLTELQSEVDKALTLGWLSVSPTEGIILAGLTEDIELMFDATGLYGGNYEVDLAINSNDPLTPQVTVPISLFVTGIPIIEVSDTLLDFGELYIGEALMDTLTILNSGTDTLEITGISSTHSDFEATVNTATLTPGETVDVYVLYTPVAIGSVNATLEISSNDTANALTIISLTGVGAEPPVIEINPTHLTSNLFTDGSEVKQLVISNTGASDLAYSIGSVDYATTSDIGLNKVYNNEEHEPPLKGQKDMRVGNPVLNSKGDDNGGFGYSWIDSNEAGGPAFDWIEISSTGTQLSLGDDGYQQINLGFDFEFYGVLKNTLYISANGFLTFNVNGAYSYGNTPLPNLNYPNDLIAAMWNDLYAGSNVYYQSEANKFIVQYNNVSYLGSGGSYTFQIILYQTGEIKIQYLSLSSMPTYYTLGIENPAGDDGMEIAYNTSYISNGLAVSISPKSNFISNLDPVNGIIPAGESDTLHVTFDATDLIGGVYEANLAINSNDPVSPEILVPLQLNVTGAPNIYLDTLAYSFGEAFVGGSKEFFINISNIGTDSLFISSVSNSESEFDFLLTSNALAIDEETLLKITFSPTSATSTSDVIEIASNDPDEPVVYISVAGSGIEPPIIGVDNSNLTEYLVVNQESSQIVTLSNTGGNSLIISEIDVVYSDGENNGRSSSALQSNLGFYADLTRVPRSENSLSEVLKNTGQSDLGDSIAVDTNIPEATTGAVMVGKHIYFVSYWDTTLIKYDTEIQAVISEIPIHPEPYGIAWDGSTFWIGNNAGNVFGYSETGELVSSFSCPFNDYPAIVWNETNFTVNPIFSTYPTFYEVDVSGTTLSSFTNDSINYNMALTYVPTHKSEGGAYWGYDLFNDKINWINLEAGSASLLQSFSTNFDDFGYSLAHDGENLILGSWNGALINYDDGIEEISWLSVDRNSGSIAPESELALNIGFNSFDLDAGMYEAHIVFDSNDPINPHYKVDVVLQVCDSTGNTAPTYNGELDLIGLSLDEEHSFDLSEVISDMENDVLDYTPSTTYGTIADVDISGNILEITPLEEGEDILELFVNDGNCNTLTVSEIFTIEFILGLDESKSNPNHLSCYPNPFTDKTSFSYTVKGNKPAFTTLALYNSQGRLVEVVFEEIQAAGEKSMDYENRKLQSGTYIVVLHIDGVKSYSKMIVK